MEIIMMILAGICLIGIIFFGLFAICAGGVMVHEDRARQKSVEIAEEPKICFDGCSRFESQMIVDRLLAEDKRRKKRKFYA